MLGKVRRIHHFSQNQIFRARQILKIHNKENDRSKTAPGFGLKALFYPCPSPPNTKDVNLVITAKPISSLAVLEGSKTQLRIRSAGRECMPGV